MDTLATIASAKRKLSDKVRVMPENYFEGVASFLGTSPATIAGSAPGEAYRDKISDPSLVDRWERNLRAAFGV